ncbi:NAD(P)-dependent oxidoreductase [Rhodopseudomonas sp. P2A-2r]|uniref:NAD-dependent epimerase/dehydratase family protein n=1 Tax=Rhodopseudomonas sp. P2A-2r TaxID=2991972 RepID=UPI002234AEF2|nr:NAD(P)-dependent oxidoreductase [Rhodopseudomonas sp. P2A-2r]UZE48086.1 NAD(P)-dependent oxidoreductase [Rhodopseudomonas sp. P2A-2r]
MRVLLTGATGFVGTAIAGHLAARRYAVVGLHARSGSGQALHCCEDIVADIGDADSVAKVAEQTQPCDYIVHAAASLNMNLFASEISHVNGQGMQNILGLAYRWQSRRFVYLSSVPVIGIPTMLPITEEHPTVPRTAYHASKLFGEQLLRLAQTQGVNGLTLRLTAPVGPGLPRNRLLAVLAARAAKHLPLELSGTGSRRQNYVDVRDVAEAVERSLTRDVAGVFNAAGDAAISNLELARECIRQCNSGSSIVFNGATDPEECFSWEVSIDKARSQLGYQPRFGIGDAVASALAEAK